MIPDPLMTSGKLGAMKRHDQYISKNFWGCVKNVVDKPLKVLLSFSSGV